jgi:hypothetical protein
MGEGKMITRVTDLHQIEKELMPLFFEMNVLESVVDKANPDVRARCEKTMRALFNQYQNVQTQVQSLNKEGEDILEESFSDIANNFHELVDHFESVVPWVWMQTSD